LRRRAINKANKSRLRTQMKRLKQAAENKNIEEARRLLPQTISLIDKSVKKGTIHRNTGNRYKSRLTRLVEALEPSSSK